MKNVLISLALLILSTSAMAAEHLEVLIGTNEANVSASDGYSEDADDIAIGFRFSSGVTDHFGFEISYRDYGKWKDTHFDSRVGEVTNDTGDTHSFNIGIFGSLPLGQGISLTGRIGGAAWETDMTIAAPKLEKAWLDDASGLDPYYGVGIQYIRDGRIISFDYSYLEFDARFQSSLAGDGDFEATMSTASISIGMVF